MARSSSNVLIQEKNVDNLVRRMKEHLISPPMYNVIFKNKQGLLHNADRIQFKKNIWNENPMQFCLEQYKNQYYYPIILICNNLGSIYEFTADNLKRGILAPLGENIGRLVLVSLPTDMRY